MFLHSSEQALLPFSVLPKQMAAEFPKERPSRRYSTPNCIVSEIGAPTFSHLILEEGLALASPLFGDGWLPRDVGGIAGGPELG